MIDLTTVPLSDLIAEIGRRAGTKTARSAAAAIIAAEAVASGLSPEIILSRSKTKLVADARKRCMAAVYRLGFSSTEVGKAFGRDHATVLHALKASA